MVLALKSLLVHHIVLEGSKSETGAAWLLFVRCLRFVIVSYMIENQKETAQEKTKSTPTVIVIVLHSTSFSIRPKTTDCKWWNGAQTIKSKRIQ